MEQEMGWGWEVVRSYWLQFSLCRPQPHPGDPLEEGGRRASDQHRDWLGGGPAAHLQRAV